MTMDRNHPVVLFVLTFVSLLGCALVIYFAYSMTIDRMEQTYAPPACAPTDCVSATDQYLASMRMELGDGGWRINDEYATVSDEDLLWMAWNLCGQLGSRELVGSPWEQDPVELAMFSMDNDLDTQLVVNAISLCGSVP